MQDEHHDHWRASAKNLLKAELKRHGIDYDSLANRLNQIGVNETKASITNKLSRGTFPFTFFLQCMEAIGQKEVRLK